MRIIAADYQYDTVPGEKARYWLRDRIDYQLSLNATGAADRRNDGEDHDRPPSRSRRAPRHGGPEGHRNPSAPARSSGRSSGPQGAPDGIREIPPRGAGGELGRACRE